MLTLRRKIFLWLLPLALSFLLFAYAYYKAREAVIIDHMLQLVELSSTVGEREISHFLSLRDAEFKLMSSSINLCNQANSPLEEVGQSALRYADGFSALVFSDPYGEVSHVELSSNQSNQYVLRQDVIGKPAFSQLDFLEIEHRYDEWKREIPELRNQEALLLSESKHMTQRGEANSVHYREVQKQLFDMRDLLKAPYPVVTVSGKELSKAAGLPFSNDTFLFTQPLLNCDDQLMGYFTAYLDRTQLEDQLFEIKSRLMNEGLNQVEVILFDNNDVRYLSEARLIDQDKFKAHRTDISAKPRMNHDFEGIVISREIDYSRVLAQKSHLHDEDHYHSLAERVWADRSKGVSLLIYVSKSEIEQFLEQLRKEVLFWSLLLIVTFAALVSLLSRHIVDPILALKEHAQAFAEGKRTQEIPFAKRTDEIGLLADSFEQMSRAVEAKEKVLTDMATHDALTGCYNRRALFSAAREELLRASRTGAKLSVCLMDLDHFKRINDHFGHQVGDNVLREFSQVVNNCLRVEDKFGRIGGEEFAVLLVGSGIDTALEVAERIRLEVYKMLIPGFDHEELTVTVSIGVSEWSEIEPFEQALSRADEKMYKAKKMGRNQIQS